MLAAGADVEAVTSEYKPDGLTPLQVAAYDGRDAVVRLLLDAGASMAVVDVNGCTPLHLAADQDREGVVRILVEAGADISAVDNDGDTPSDLADDPVKEVLTAAEQARSLAFAMGLQERLGAASLVRGLDPEVVRMVLEAGGLVLPMGVPHY